MTSQEFVIWLRGFTEGVHEYNITPKQWDYLKDKLKEVEDQVQHTVYQPYLQPTNPHKLINPYYIGDVPNINSPYNPYGTGGSSGVITTGTSTHTTRSFPTGSVISYTHTK